MSDDDALRRMLGGIAANVDMARVNMSAKAENVTLLVLVLGHSKLQPPRAPTMYYGVVLETEKVPYEGVKVLGRDLSEEERESARENAVDATDVVNTIDRDQQIKGVRFRIEPYP